MAFFGPQANQNPQPKKDNKKTINTDRFDLYVLAVGKQAHLSFIEMNELSVIDVLEFARIYLGDGDDENTEQIPTQKDIDQLLA
jgi:hypothetical protein